MAYQKAEEGQQVFWHSEWEHWGLEKTFKLQMKIAGRWGGRGLGDRGGWEVTARNFPGAYFILICAEWHLPLSCLSWKTFAFVLDTWCYSSISQSLDSLKCFISDQSQWNNWTCFRAVGLWNCHVSSCTHLN